jgi:hypothetical protein
MNGRYTAYERFIIFPGIMSPAKIKTVRYRGLPAKGPFGTALAVIFLLKNHTTKRRKKK